MKTIRTYQKACDWCQATGFVKKDPQFSTTSSLTDICPVCHGNKTILVTEEFDSPSPEIPEISDEEAWKKAIEFYSAEETHNAELAEYNQRCRLAILKYNDWLRTKLREGGKKDE